MSTPKPSCYFQNPVKWVTTRHLWGLKARCSLPRQREVGFELWLLAPPLKVMGLLIFPSLASSSVRGGETPAFGRNSMKHLVLSPQTIISMTPSKLKSNSKSQFTAYSNYRFISVTSWRTQPLLSITPGDTQDERWDLPKDSDCAVSILITPLPHRASRTTPPATTAVLVPWWRLSHPTKKSNNLFCL